MSFDQRLHDLSDESLMLRVKEGDHRAFEILVSRYEQKLLSFAYRLLGDFDGAKDLVMETFLRIYKHALKYEPRSKFSTYIYKVTRNLCINEFKKREFRKTDSLDELGINEGFEYAGSSLNPAEVLERSERQQLVQKALSELPEDQKTILILTEFQGMSYERVAQVMGCSMGTVKSRIHRARKKIKEWMERHEL